MVATEKAKGRATAKAGASHAKDQFFTHVSRTLVMFKLVREPMFSDIFLVKALS